MFLPLVLNVILLRIWASMAGRWRVRFPSCPQTFRASGIVPQRFVLYRLHVFPVDIPSLRERVEDIPLLVEYFIDRYAREADKNVIRSVDKKTLQLLQSYSSPENIHELQNAIERSVIVCETENSSVDASWLSQEPPQRRSIANVLQLLKRLAHHRVFPQPARKLISRPRKRCFVSASRTCWNKA